MKVDVTRDVALIRRGLDSFWGCDVKLAREALERLAAVFEGPPLDSMCTCGHTAGAHRCTPPGQASGCKANGDTCTCEDFMPVESRDR